MNSLTREQEEKEIELLEKELLESGIEIVIEDVARTLRPGQPIAIIRKDGIRISRIYVGELEDGTILYRAVESCEGPITPLCKTERWDMDVLHTWNPPEQALPKGVRLIALLLPSGFQRIVQIDKVHLPLTCSWMPLA